MWQAATFDSATIDQELGYAEAIEMNCMRVFLHHTAWQEDPVGFKKKMATYLSIAAKHGVKTMFVFFDDCWSDHYTTGKQQAPKPGIHNSGWIKDPGSKIDTSPLLMDTLKTYVQDILASFLHDRRILMWDLYNEPEGGQRGNRSLPLLKKVFRWARAVNPDQPLTTGYWIDELKDIDRFVLSHSDIMTYHCYEDAALHQKRIDSLKTHSRSMICTEYMACKRGSTFQSILPLLKRTHRSN